MSFMRAYDRIGNGLNMSSFGNGFTFISAGDGPVTTLMSDEQYDSNTWLASFDVESGGVFRHMGIFYNPDAFGNIVIESIYCFDRAFKSILDWHDASIFISYADLVSGGDNWFFDGFNGSDTIIGNRFRDIIKSGDSDDTIRGKGGHDLLFGERGNDVVLGEHGNDRMLGASGDDALTGGRGADLLTGGAGFDRFIFNSIAEAGSGRSRDTITDFDLRRDYIVLSRIDADVTLRDNQAFEFIGRARFDGEAGELRCRGGIVSGDVDGDGIADFQIDVGLSLRAIDFVL